MSRLLLFLAASLVLAAAPKRVLYLTATPGFRHVDAIDASIPLMQEIARDSDGALEIVHSEDVSLISADNLRDFDAVWFFTSGELPLSDRQKSDLLDFVRQGKGFGGSHSATDSNYTWPEYGDLIGGYFDGHPWAQEAAVDVEDPENPIVAHLAPSFRFTEEFYQFRSWSRDSVRVLLTLDTRSVNMSADGVHRTDGDFALAWTRPYGKGRVFYSAFGHFPESWTAAPMREMLRRAMLWLAGQIDADPAPRAANPVIADVRGLAPGAIVTISGAQLTSGSTLSAAATPLPVRLAGTHVEVNGISAPIFSVTPTEVVAQLPAALVPGDPAALTVSSVNNASAPIPLAIVPSDPTILFSFRAGNTVVLYATGLGATEPPVPDGQVAPATPRARTIVQPAVTIASRPATVFFSALVPGLVGIYEIQAVVVP